MRKCFGVVAQDGPGDLAKLEAMRPDCAAGGDASNPRFVDEKRERLLIMLPTLLHEEPGRVSDVAREDATTRLFECMRISCTDCIYSFRTMIRSVKCVQLIFSIKFFFAKPEHKRHQENQPLLRLQCPQTQQ